MGNISIQGKADHIKTCLNMEFRQAMKESRIDRSETCFAGKGTLTMEEYQKGMALAAKAQNI